MAKKLVKKRHRKIGVSPGTLIHLGEQKLDQALIDTLEYNTEQVWERQFDVATVEQSCRLRPEAKVSWINLVGLHQIGCLETLGRCFNLHPLVMEDILNTEHRPKLEEFEDHLFIVVKMLQFDDASNEIRTEQVSLILGRNYVLTFQEREGDVFEGVRERIRNGKGRLRDHGADYLAYILLDALVDNYFLILEKLGDQIEELEDQLIHRPTPATMQTIHHFKREMILLRKAIWPLREVISGLQRQQGGLISDATGAFLRDLYDHSIQILDTVETLRDILAGLLDLYLSSLSHRMNEIMKVLTLIATIFIPLTFIVGVYGMNFDNMPELHWKYGYFGLWGVMLVIGLLLLWFFRRKHWL